MLDALFLKKRCTGVNPALAAAWKAVQASTTSTRYLFDILAEDL